MEQALVLGVDAAASSAPWSNWLGTGGSEEFVVYNLFLPQMDGSPFLGSGCTLCRFELWMMADQAAWWWSAVLCCVRKFTRDGRKFFVFRQGCGVIFGFRCMMHPSVKGCSKGVYCISVRWLRFWIVDTWARFKEKDVKVYVAFYNAFWGFEKEKIYFAPIYLCRAYLRISCDHFVILNCSRYLFAVSLLLFRLKQL